MQQERKQRLFKRSARLAWLTLLPAALSSCMVGPDFHAPKAPTTKTYNAHPLPTKTASANTDDAGGREQYFASRKDIPAEWWTLFHSPVINELIERGLENSPNLIAAEATLSQAQETLKAQIGNSLYPAFNANLGGTRQRFATSTVGANTPSMIFNLFNANVSVTYTLDIFGGARRQIEALLAQVDYQQFQLIGAYLTLTANIVTTAIAAASYESQIVTTKALIKAQAGQLDVLYKQFELGGISLTTVLTQQTLVDQTRATLPLLEKNLSQANHQLAVLVGDLPNRPIPKIRLEKLMLPQALPSSLPSELVRQRPDVRASEALMHAASAQVGVATAALFPQFNFSGADGWIGSVPSSLFNQSTQTWNYGLAIVQPIFHGGALLATRRAAIDAYNVSAAQYRQTLLQAFQNVADALRALDTDARSFQAQKNAEIAAKRGLALIQDQFKLGGVSYLDLLTAQQQYQQTVISSIQAEATRYADTAALYAALGGGWWNVPRGCGNKINPTSVSKICPE